jgi:hypothetical protein
MDIFLIYNKEGERGAGERTGSLLADAMDINHGDKLEAKPDVLIRWGVSRRVRYKPNIGVLNSRRALRNNINKFRAFKLLADAELSLPKFSKNPNDLNYPMLGRGKTHQEGNDICLILQKEDLRFIRCCFYTEYVKKHKEFRVHIIGGKPVIIGEKTFKGEPNDYSALCWNREHKFKLKNRRALDIDVLNECVKAVKVLGLDFGAVDLIIGEDNNPYILEVNSCPRLDRKHREIYAKELRGLINERWI